MLADHNPSDPWSVVATRVFENGTYVSLPSGNGGPGIFSAISPAAGESVSSVGSADNPVTPYYFWWANLTAGGQTSTVRFNPGLPYRFPENNNLTIWSAPGSNNATSETQECHELPDNPNLPDDRSNVIVLLHRWDCWKYPNGTQVAITQAFGIPYSLRYSPSTDTIERGLWFYDEREDFSLKGTFLVESSVGLELLELVQTHDAVHISVPADVSTANATLEYEENKLSGSLTSNFSSWGPTLTGRSMPYFLAPGGNILSTYPAWIGGWGVIGGMHFQSIPALMDKMLITHCFRNKYGHAICGRCGCSRQESTSGLHALRDSSRDGYDCESCKME